MKSQATAAECVRSLRTAKTNSFSFHGQLAEYWSRYDSTSDFDFITDNLINDERIARNTLTFLVERAFNASRHADLMRLIRRNFPNRHEYIKGWFYDVALQPPYSVQRFFCRQDLIEFLSLRYDFRRIKKPSNRVMGL